MTQTAEKTAALIVAAGRGTRAGTGLPKQWRALAGKRVADWTLSRFRNHPGIDHVALVVHPDDAAHYDTLDVDVVFGGDTRDASVRNGLEALAGKGFDNVLIHDVARATVPDHCITDVINALKTSTGAAPALPVTDALWRGQDGHVT
ncbi:MAG: 2-C-methyl-D-erythritol 4-phosphate cytidylyltransferase, partial [Cognatishimia sp.]